MDFLDPKKQRRHAITLFIGYMGVALAILLATILLLELAWGYRRGKDGQVVQYGSLFVSSQPAGADITLNKLPTHKTTNTRISLVGGQYFLQLNRTDYRPWQQSLTVNGGAISRYDYPFLFPNALKTDPVASYAAFPGLATQSPNRRWLIVQQPGSDTVFDEYDLKNPKNPAVTLTLPAGLVTSGSASTYAVVSWADDNVHVLLQHSYDSGKSEYVLLDRANLDQSRNLSQTLGTTPTKLSFINKKYDQYYLYDQAAQTLQSASLSNPTPVAVLNHVLAYQSYGTNVILYASSLNAPSGKVEISLLQAGKTYNLRAVAANTTYLLDLTRYKSAWYVVLGASSEAKAYVYKNPVTQLTSAVATLSPIYVLRTKDAPSYVSFSANDRFIVVESGSQFAVFDAENEVGYRYDTQATLDSPQLHGGWMDGSHLEYVSNGKLVVFDFDHGNQQTLMPATPSYLPFFGPDYHFVDTIAPSSTAGQQAALTSTSLLTPADQ